MLLNAATLLLAFGLASSVLADYYPITGVKVDNGPLPIRRNIDDLQKENGPQWHLYIQALSSMYEMDSDDPLSFFQIAGIHGWPWIEWNNTGKTTANGWAGYCPHGQSLVSAAKQIASQYPQNVRKQYEEAANTLRAPYWDWASTEHVPPSTGPGEVTITTPKGKNQKVTNPLANYKFPEKAVGGVYGDLPGAAPVGSRPQGGKIQRCPGQSYPDFANNIMSRQVPNPRSRSYRSMVDFTRFGSTSGRGFSLEQIHNTVHTEATCGADFLDSRISGFDPLFMLHHANVDRLWAYWQASFPKESIFNGSYSGGSRFTTPARTMIGPDSALAPFFGANNQAHTSKTVVSIKDFGYSYEGLEFGSMSESELEKSATRMIGKLYGPFEGKFSDTSENEIPSDNPSGKKPGNCSGKNSDNCFGKNPDDPSSKKPGNCLGKSSDDPSGKNPDNCSGKNPDDTSSRKPDNPSSKNPEDPSSNNPDNPSGKKPPLFGKPPFGTNSTGPYDRPLPGRPGSGRPPLNGTRPGSNTPQQPSDVYPTQPKFAQVRVNVEEVERPCRVNIFVGNFFAGSIHVLAQPSTGFVSEAIFLNDAIQRFGKSGNGSTSAVENNIHCEVVKRDGQLIELSSVPSLVIETEEVVLTPRISETEIPKPKERKAQPVAKFSPPPPGSPGSVGGPNLPPITESQQDNGNGGYSPGADKGDDQDSYKYGKPKATPKPEKPKTVSAAGRAGPWPVLVYVSACLLLLV
ncbi:hypothetical protein CDD80_5330 [Ophiocordyceps camponoti-rufipedis]|uniref:Tyrosinase copper-binding domain-containing protein n=1 Tax=Ophiocordyceps camponoti-rufipedis TaxID=2004952 RepID=A0A2C5ZGV6_9HYPO|nr:hypothetical protein CDD80_5330 [Ophiocordyceps camponoti-rufipedis]